jgi:1-deoxy-D-xylulose-5-phosphate synthase
VERLARAGVVVTCEEGTTRGGLGAAVLEAVSDAARPPRVKLVGLPGDAFIRHGEARAQRAALGLDAAGIRRTVEALLSS